MRSTDLIILTGVLTLINSVMLGLNLAFTLAISSTVDRIDLHIVEFILKGDKENKNNALDTKLYKICRQAFKSGKDEEKND